MCPRVRHSIPTSWKVWRKQNFPLYCHTLQWNTQWNCRTVWGNQMSAFEGHMAAPRQSLPSDFPPYQYFKLLMRKRTDCKCSPQRPQPSGKPSALVSPHCSTYVVIDQAPVPARHICAQTSVALIWPTVTDDQASGGWCRWWMNESAVCYFLSLSVFRRAVRRVIITPHLYSLSGGWEHSALIK